MRIFPHKHRVCAVPFLRFPVKFVRLSLSYYVTRTSPHKHRFCAVLFSRLPFKFTRLYWSCFVVRVFRFTRFCGIRLVNAGFVIVAGCFYSPGSACFMYLFLCFNICRFAITCVICIQFGVQLLSFLLLLSLPDLAPFLLSVQPNLVQFFSSPVYLDILFKVHVLRSLSAFHSVYPLLPCYWWGLFCSAPSPRHFI